jgi:sensor c-di-GMP phosphodiesterase-like protein
VTYIRTLSLPALDLERAIAQRQFKPYYQPLVDLSTGRVAGCEVLIRWEKRDGKLVPPSVFIDYAEASGMAIPMTISLMQQVKQDLSDLCADHPNLKIGINLFDGHFVNADIVSDVESIFGGSRVGFRQLVFEITERRPLENRAAAASVIGGLQARGCRLAMDDVGTGHSNLAYMQTLGVDIIKIDKVFIDMIGDGNSPVPVLDGLINMANELGTSIVAEGVETPEQAVYLREHGVFQAQGYLFAPALTKKAFIDLTRSLNGDTELGDDVAAMAEPDDEDTGKAEPSATQAA